MDTFLSDIKDYLVKLENSQLDIEAGQWQLHMDMAIIRESFKEIRQLRRDLDELRVTNTEQLGIIRELQTKLGAYQAKSGEAMPVCECGKGYEESEKSCTGFENCEGDEDNDPDEGDEDPDGGDDCGKLEGFEQRRKAEVKKISSESFKGRNVCQYGEPQDTMTIISDKSTNPKDESSFEEMRKFSNFDCENSNSKGFLRGSRDGSPGCAEILYRYLKDSAKYSNPRASRHGQSEPQGSNEKTRSEGENKGQCENYHDESTGTIGDEEDSATRHPESLKKMESVLPKGFTSPNFRRKYMVKQGLDEDEHRPRTHHKNKGKQGAPKNRYKMPKDFKCKFCDRACRNYLELKTHLRKCATLMRASINMK